MIVGGTKPDVGRVRLLITEDPSVVKRISANTAGFILAPLIIHRWGTPEGKTEILDLLIAHGFGPDVEQSMRYYGDDTYPIAAHLRELLCPKRAAAKKATRTKKKS